MKKATRGLLALGLSAAALSGAGAQAGGIDRALLNTNLIFEDGRKIELGFSNGNPMVSGSYAPDLGGGSTGDMAESFSALSFGIKSDLNDHLSWAVIAGQPQQANARYGAGAYTGLEAHWRTTETDALLRYKLGNGLSVHGGLRYVVSNATISLPNALMGGTGAYSASAGTDGHLGYLVGAAYEKPEIALRVALTWSSAIKHGFDTVETHPRLGGTLAGETDITLPQSVTLEGQTGVAPGTLVFGSIRWAEWSKWQVSPPGFKGLPPPFPDTITGFDHNVFTYTLGVGRKISDSLSLAASASYEKATGGVSSRLSPTDGMRSIGIAAIYTTGAAKITAGMQYQLLGDAVDGSTTRFTDNSGVGFGLKLDYSF